MVDLTHLLFVGPALVYSQSHTAFSLTIDYVYRVTVVYIIIGLTLTLACSNDIQKLEFIVSTC